MKQSSKTGPSSNSGQTSDAGLAKARESASPHSRTDALSGYPKMSNPKLWIVVAVILALLLPYLWPRSETSPSVDFMPSDLGQGNQKQIAGRPSNSMPTLRDLTQDVDRAGQRSADGGKNLREDLSGSNGKEHAGPAAKSLPTRPELFNEDGADAGDVDMLLNEP